MSFGQPRELLKKNSFQIDKKVQLTYRYFNDEEQKIGLMRIAPRPVQQQSINFLQLQANQISSQSPQNKNELVSDHDCLPDRFLRCEDCSRALNEAYYSQPNNQTTLDITYYDYIALINKEAASANSSVVFVKITNSLQMVDYVYQILDRSKGFSFSEVNFPPPSLNEHHSSYLRQIQPSNYEIFGDFENSNIDTVLYCGFDLVKIILRSDTNTKGYANWFYFGLNMKTSEPRQIKFQILNQRKTNEQIQGNIKVFTVFPFGNFSWNKGGALDCFQNQHPRKVYQRDSSSILKEVEFSKVGHNFIDMQKYNLNPQSFEQQLSMKSPGVFIKNRQQSQKRQDLKLIKNYYCQSEFTYEYEPGEHGLKRVLLFAPQIPYTYTDLIDFFQKTEQKLCAQGYKYGYEAKVKNDQTNRTLLIQTKNVFYQRIIVSHTRLGLPIYEITISKSQKLQNKIIFIVSREHPDNPQQNHFMDQWIDLLTDEIDPLAIHLRSLFSFRIVPMLNCDGVILGNSKTNLSGYDLSKSWCQVEATMTPETQLLTDHLEQLSGEKFIVFQVRGGKTNKLTGKLTTSNGQLSQNFMRIMKSINPTLKCKDPSQVKNQSYRLKDVSQTQLQFKYFFQIVVEQNYDSKVSNLPKSFSKGLLSFAYSHKNSFDISYGINRLSEKSQPEKIQSSEKRIIVSYQSQASFDGQISTLNRKQSHQLDYSKKEDSVKKQRKEERIRTDEYISGPRKQLMRQYSLNTVTSRKRSQETKEQKFFKTASDNYFKYLTQHDSEIKGLIVRLDQEQLLLRSNDLDVSDSDSDPDDDLVQTEKQKRYVSEVIPEETKTELNIGSRTHMTVRGHLKQPSIVEFEGLFSQTPVFINDKERLESQNDSKNFSLLHQRFDHTSKQKTNKIDIKKVVEGLNKNLKTLSQKRLKKVFERKIMTRSECSVQTLKIKLKCPFLPERKEIVKEYSLKHSIQRPETSMGNFRPSSSMTYSVVSPGIMNKVVMYQKSPTGSQVVPYLQQK